MPSSFRLLSLVFLLTTAFSCQQERPSPLDELVGTEWEFSLDNPVKPEKGKAFFSQGASLRIGKDSATVHFLFTGRNLTYPLQPAEALTDTLAESLLLLPSEDGSLRVSKLKNGQVVQERKFIPKREQLELFDLDKLAGKTYWFQAPGQDRSRVYFGYDEQLALAKASKHYYVSGHAAQEESRTLPQTGGTFYGDISGAMPRPVRKSMIFLVFKNPSSLGSQRFEIYADQDGAPFVEYTEVEDGHFVRRQVKLAPMEESPVAQLSLEAFCSAVSTGKQFFDDSYPRIDSAKVKYLYEEDFRKGRGIAYADLSKLHLELNPDGEFFLTAGQRLIRYGNWTFSPDHNYLIQIGKDGRRMMHIPILTYNDQLIELRWPLKVSTREPRGVALTSYSLIDAFVRIER